jgi:hypothetical protein
MVDAPGKLTIQTLMTKYVFLLLLIIHLLQIRLLLSNAMRYSRPRVMIHYSYDLHMS